ncbi:MAG TPA: hypothetical protein VFZ89_20075, partial [Solirubrobacteraceae bacterium]
QPATNSPDLRSVAVDPSNDLTDGLGERARFCFDSNIATVGAGWLLMSYDARRYWSGTAARATDDEKCAVVTYKAGSDIAQATVGQVAGGAVADVAGHKNIVASEPVGGSVAAPAAGATTGPDLVRVDIDTSQANNFRAKFVFDENLNPAPTRPDGADQDNAAEDAYQLQDFGYVTASGQPVFHAAGNAPAPSGNSITINFGAAPLDEAVRFVTQPNAVEDRPQTGKLGNLSLVTPSSPGVVVKNPETGGRPDLVKAEAAGANAYRLTYSTGVASPVAGKFQAVADDGTVSAVAASVGTGGTQDSLLVQFPDSEALTKDPGSVVRIVSADGAVKNSTDATKSSIYGQAATQTANNTPGYTNGPDLRGVIVDPTTQRTSFVYDEPVAAGSGADAFFGFRADATSAPGNGAVSTTGPSVTVPFGAGIAAFVAYGQGYGAVADPIGRPSPNQSVSTALQVAPPPPPATGGAVRTKVKTSFRSFHRRGRTYSGRVGSAQRTCRYNRRVILRKRGKGTRRYGQALTRKDGTFKIRRSRRVGGRVYAVVTEKTTKAIHCRTARSKTIRG